MGALPITGWEIAFFRGVVEAPSQKEMLKAIRKQSKQARSRERWAAMYLTASARDLDEFKRVAHYSDEQLARWWQRTTLTSKGSHLVQEFYKAFDKRGFFG